MGAAGPSWFVNMPASPQATKLARHFSTPQSSPEIHALHKAVVVLQSSRNGAENVWVSWKTSRSSSLRSTVFVQYNSQIETTASET